MMNERTLDHFDPARLAAFGRGILDHDEMAEVEAHLALCDSCCQVLSNLPDDEFAGLLRAARNQSDLDPSLWRAANLTAAARMTFDAPTFEIPSSFVLPGSGSSSEVGSTLAAGDLSGPESSDLSLERELPRELANHPRYRIVKRLGTGGMGTVYLAEHRLMDRPVALKVIRADLLGNEALVKRFRREVRAAARLASHPNIVAAHDAEQAGETHVLVMEFIEGTDLARLVEHRGPLPVGEACEYVRQAAVGLQHASEDGMVHRDIKPQNLMRTTRGQIKILDLGLARFASEVTSQAGVTALGMVLGSADYIAPEQISDPHAADVRADIYSLGCTLYFLLAGQPPFHDGTLIQKLKSHSEHAPRPLAELRADVPPELARVVERMTAKDPAQRFQTPDEVAGALTPFADAHAARTAVTDPLFDPSCDAPGPAAASEPGDRVWSKAVERVNGHGPSAWWFAAWPLLLGLVIVLAALTFRVKTKYGVIVLENVPENAVVEVDGDRVTITPTGGEPVRIEARAGKHGVVVRRGDDVLLGESVTLESGKQSKLNVWYEAPSARSQSKGDFANFTAHSAAGRSTASPSLPRGWVSLFNGKDLAGWTTHPSQPGTWRVKNGVLIGSGPEISHLYTERGDYKDFHLRVEARLDNGDHGGVCFRSSFGPKFGYATLSAVEKPMWPAAYVALINSTRADQGKTGSLVREQESAHGVFPNEVISALDGPTRVAGQQWFALEVIAERNIITIMVNGKMTAYDADIDQLYSGGHIALQRSNHTHIEFRKIEIKELNSLDREDARELRRFVGHTGRVNRVAFAPDGRTLLSGGAGWELKIGNDSNRTFMTSTAMGDNSLRLWDADTGRSRFILTEDFNEIVSLAFSADGRFAASCTDIWREDKVPIWNLETGRRAHIFREPALAGANNFPPGLTTEVSFSRVDRRVFAARSNGIVQVWDLETEKEQPSIMLNGEKGETFQDREFPRAAFTGDGLRLVTGSQNGAVELWDLQSGKRIRTMAGQIGAVRGLACSANGRLIVSGGSDNTVRLWDADSGKELKSIKGDDKELRCVALSPDGRRALSAGNDAVVRLWDLNSGKEICRLAGHTMGINSVAFSTDGRRGLSGSDDGTVRLWQLP